MTTHDKDTPAYLERNAVPIEPATGMTFQQWAQKNRADKRLAEHLSEIVRANCSEPDPED